MKIKFTFQRLGCQLGGAIILLQLCAMTGLVASAQQTSTLLVLRPKLKAKDNDRISTIAPVVDSSIIAPVLPADVSEIRIGGKPANITAWTPLLNGPTTLQLVVLFDLQQRIGIGHQFEDIRNFFNSLPPNVEISVGFLVQGRAKIVQPFTADRKLAGSALYLPTKEESISPKDDTGDPYYCLHDLALHWPDPDSRKVRAAVVFTDGTPRYNTSGDENGINQEVEMTSNDLIRAGIAVFPVFYVDLDLSNGPQRSRSIGSQSSLDQLAAATNGQALYWPQVTTTLFSPLLYRLYSILYSEAVITVTPKGSGLQTLDIKSSRDEMKVIGPDKVMIGNKLQK